MTTWCHSSGCRLGEIITEDKLLIPGRDGMTSIPNTGKVQIGPNLNDVARPTLEEVRAMVWGEKLSRTNG
ncbi:hypothetical protein KKE60_05025 [Patescibacteria group bacterium]|nr:hypothetical protein [Patescibacteria group bacterium]